MTPVDTILLLATGVFAGFSSGLLGIGGGFILTPVQYIVFTNMGLPTDTAIRLAFGTTLMVVLPTAISGAWRHSRKGAVLWKTAIIMGACGALAAFGGATLAAHLPGAALRTAFGAIVLLSSIRMLMASPLPPEQPPRYNSWLLVAWSIPIGILTCLLGSGGGILMVPLLVLVLKLNMHNAAATLLAAMIFISIGGIIGYMINGINVSGLPDFSVGYVNLTSWFLLAVSSVGMAQLGAITAHKLPAAQLRYLLILIMLYMGLKMLGVFAWLGWPI